jgi:glycosyltransferase A (GT-A) superfamily protein (DUF2064 family)
VSIAVGVMARAPSSAGKTRLAPHVSPARLTALRAAMLADTLDALAPLANVTIFFTPDECLAEMTAIDGSRPLVPQGSGDLGYYLVGMTRVRPELFEGIAWGSASVLSDTLSAADRIGADAHLVRGAYDVDTIDDLRRLERDLAAAPAHVGAHVRRWLRAGQGDARLVS